MTRNKPSRPRAPRGSQEKKQEVRTRALWLKPDCPTIKKLWSRLTEAPRRSDYSKSPVASTEPLTGPFWAQRVSTLLTLLLILLPICGWPNETYAIMSTQSPAGEVYVGAFGACDAGTTSCGFLGNEAKILLIDDTQPKDDRVAFVWEFILAPGVVLFLTICILGALRHLKWKPYERHTLLRKKFLPPKSTLLSMIAVVGTLGLAFIRPTSRTIILPRPFKLAPPTGVFPSDREGVPRFGFENLDDDDCTNTQYGFGLSLFTRVFKVDSQKTEVAHIDIARDSYDSDNDMQMMDQTPTPTGTSDSFSFSPTTPPSQPLQYASATDDFAPVSDATVGNPDPFWTEDLFTSETEQIREEQADLGKMGKDGDVPVQEDIYQWREGRDPTPTAESEKPLPLHSESPVPRAQDDITPKQQQYLHNLIPALGVSTPKPIQSNTFHLPQYPHLATSPPDQLRKQASLAAAAAVPVPGSPSNASIGSSGGTPPPKLSAGGTPSALGRYYLSASDPQHISKHPQGSISFPDPSIAQYHPVLPQLSPLLKNRGGMMGNPEASPTLSIASDETFIPSGTSPKTGSTMSSSPQQSLFPPMNKVVPSSGFGTPQQRNNQAPPNVNAFSSYPYASRPVGTSTAESGTGASPLAQVHQSFAGIPSGPLGSGQPPPRIHPNGIPMSPDGGSTSTFGSVSRSAPVGGVGTQHQRPLLRQATADSFMSTSSEEEDLSSPMILPDTSLRSSDRPVQQTGKESPRFGNGAPGTPRGSIVGGIGKSPRMGIGAGAVSAGSGGGSLFPPLSSVTKVRAGAVGSGHGAVGASKFAFQTPSGAPVFPPMSPSSSSSGESGDEGTGGSAKRSGRGHGWRFRSKSPFVSANNSQATTDGTDEGGADAAGGNAGNGHENTSGDADSEAKAKEEAEAWARYRAGSITVGGVGYGNGGSGDGEDSDEDEDGKRRRRDKADKKLETSALPTTAGAKKSHQETDRKSAMGKDPQGDESDDEGEEDEEEDDEDGDSLESEDGYQNAAGGASGPFPGGKAVRPPAKRKHPNSKSADRDERDESPLEEGTTVTRTRKDGTVVRKKRKSAPAEEGDVFCDYVEPLPPHERCTSHFHRTYDLARHRETIHARNEGRAVEGGKLKEEDAKLWIEFGRPQCSWPCPYPNCGQIFSRKDAMQRHLKTKRHEGV